MDNFIGFIAVVLAALCAIFTIAFASDVPYLKNQQHPVQYTLLGVCCIALTGYGAWRLW